MFFIFSLLAFFSLKGIGSRREDKLSNPGYIILQNVLLLDDIRGIKKPLHGANISVIEAMLPSCHPCKAAESCCGSAEYAAEVIHSEKPERPQIGQDTPDGNEGTETSLGPIEEQDSIHQSLGWKKITQMSHMEIDHEVTRGIPLHRALRHSELWTSPHEIRRRHRAAEVWKLSTRVSTFDIFLSHTWQTKGRWKVLALLMQTGWLHALLGWSIGLAVMLCLRAFGFADDPWDNVVYFLAGKRIPVSLTPWTVLFAEVSMILGLCSSPFLPFKTRQCFLDIACIHQDQNELFERGLYMFVRHRWVPCRGKGTLGLVLTKISIISVVLV